MSLEIESIFSERGYNEIVDFCNAELAIPTGGMHSTIISDINADLPLKDYYMFAQELYTTANKYRAAFFVTAKSELLVLENKTPVHINKVALEVKTLFEMVPDGLDKMYSGIIDLYDNYTGLKSAEMQVYRGFQYGDDTYYAHLRDATGKIIASGQIWSKFIKDQVLGSYNIKIDKSIFDTLTVKGSRNQYTKFQVEIAPGIFENYKYSKVGDLVFVQDTVKARESLRVLAKRGVVFIDF